MAKKLTYSAEIAIVRRFREYPDRAVGKIQRTDGWRKTHAIWLHRLTQVREWLFALHWMQEIHRRAFLITDSSDLNVVSLRPIAIVPATPSTLDGLCGPEQRNGVGSSFEVKGKTLGHRRLLCLACCTASQTQQQGRSSSETLQRSQFFACTAVYTKEAKPSLARLTQVSLHRFTRFY